MNYTHELHPWRFPPMNYVLGFAFSEDGNHVVLVRKNGASVPSHRGLLNGVGGKIEPGELAQEAMKREFLEETGVRLSRWRERGVIQVTNGDGLTIKDEIQVFSTHSDLALTARTPDNGEPIMLIPVNLLQTFEVVPRLAWLLPLLRDNNVGGFALHEKGE